MSHHAGRSAASQFFMEGEYGEEDEDYSGGSSSGGRRTSSSSGLGVMTSRHSSSRIDSGFDATDYQDENEVDYS